MIYIPNTPICLVVFFCLVIGGCQKSKSPDTASFPAKSGPVHSTQESPSKKAAPIDADTPAPPADAAADVQGDVLKPREDGASSDVMKKTTEKTPLNLLRAVETDMAVSSVYRNRTWSADLMVDGNMETAWNSRTGDLAGSWIEVRLPSEVFVTSIALTVGFTKKKPKVDLFTGNQRVHTVRVLYEGTALGTFELDTQNRELQTLAVTGRGGVYRIELTAFEAGSKPGWQEACISELQFMGYGEKTMEGERFPRIAVGQLPQARPLPKTGDKANLRKLVSGLLNRFNSEWKGLELAKWDYIGGTDPESPPADELDGFRRTRRTFLRDLAEVVELVDPVQADRLRYAATLTAEWNVHNVDGVAHPTDFAQIAKGFSLLNAWIEDEKLACRSEKTLTQTLLAEFEKYILNDYAGAEFDASPSQSGGEPGVRERASQLWDLSEAIGSMEDLWSTNPHSVTNQLEALAKKHNTSDPKWKRLLAQVTVTRQKCGWEKTDSQLPTDSDAGGH